MSMTEISSGQVLERLQPFKIFLGEEVFALTCNGIRTLEQLESYRMELSEAVTAKLQHNLSELQKRMLNQGDSRGASVLPLIATAADLNGLGVPPAVEECASILGISVQQATTEFVTHVYGQSLFYIKPVNLPSGVCEIHFLRQDPQRPEQSPQQYGDVDWTFLRRFRNAMQRYMRQVLLQKLSGDMPSSQASNLVQWQFDGTAVTWAILDRALQA